MAGPPDWATFTTPTGQVRKVILPRGATKYPNAEARAKLIEAFKLGGTPELAALYAGIDIDTCATGWSRARCQVAETCTRSPSW